jgi:cobalt-precorrin-6B (C15)-methyltransferase
MNDYATYGIPDDSFIRNDVPMTKEEIRVITISKLRLKDDHTLIDIGAGTGSLSIEAARILKNGKVYAIDKNENAVNLIKKNIEKFRIGNIKIIHTNMPDRTLNIKADRIIIGGSGKNLRDILKWSDKNLNKNGRITANSITIETLNEIKEFMTARIYKNIDIIQVSINKIKKAGDKNMFTALNPVFIISGDKN